MSLDTFSSKRKKRKERRKKRKKKRTIERDTCV